MTAVLAVRRRLRLLLHQTRRLDPSVKGMLWAALSGALLTLLNAFMRLLTRDLDVFEIQFLRYLAGCIVLLPWVWRHGIAYWRPRHVGGQFLRGAVHTAALCLWFLALPHITLADTTAISFTGPIFIMMGAALFLGERMRWDRWVAAVLGFAGVLVVVAPRLSGAGGVYTVVMLAAVPVFAASFLLTKPMTRYERTEVIVLWQAITVTLLSLPLALLHWKSPQPWHLGVFALCGLLGSAGHYCLTRSFRVADLSATQSVKFLELVWSSLWGLLLFADIPSHTTIAGGLVILASTVWLARREARG